MMKKVVLSCVLTGLLAGCASTPLEEQKPAAVEDRATGAQRPDTAQPGTDTRPAGGAAVAADPLKDPSNILSKRSIYYDFDSFLVKDEYKPIVQAHANYLRQHSERQVILQGNADERGSREYNLALGQKRAESVKRMMELLGVSASRIETVSFGEEKPRCTEHNEACWSQNRRTDIVYRGE
ncbi:peptidoglycan-associated lipoprotein Pal [Pelomicrobium methylotrophicum]